MTVRDGPREVLNQGGPKLGLAAIFSASVHKHTNNVTFTKPWGHQTRCGHSQSAYWPFHLPKDESPKPVAKWWEPQTKPVVEDFCQSAVFVRIEWRWISTELTDHGKCIGNYLRCLCLRWWQQTWRWQKIHPKRIETDTVHSEKGGKWGNTFARS